MQKIADTQKGILRRLLGRFSPGRRWGSGTLLPALMLPFVFRFGVDKGRMWIMLIAIAFGIGAGLLSMDEGSAVSQLAARLTALPLWLLPLAGLTVFALSAFVSVQIYRRREL